MAEVLVQFSEPPTRKTRYPAEEWSDGKIRRIRRGVDYVVSEKSVIQSLYAIARARNKKCRMRVYAACVEFQMYDPGPAVSA